MCGTGQHVVDKLCRILRKNAAQFVFSFVQHIPAAVFDFSDARKRGKFSAAGKRGVGARKFAQGVAFAQPAQRKCEGFVFFVEPKSHALQIPCAPFGSELPQKFDRGNVIAVRQRLSCRNIAVINIFVIGRGVTVKIGLFIQNGRTGRQQPLFNGGGVYRQRLYDRARLPAQFSLSRIQGANGVFVVAANRNAPSAAVRRGAQRLRIALQRPVEIGIHFAPAAHGVGGEQGELVKFARYGVEIALCGNGVSAAFGQRRALCGGAFRLVQHPQLFHLFQNAVAHGFAFFGGGKRGIAVGRTNDRRQRCRFRRV